MQKGKKRTVAFHTLGCKLNFSESSEIGRQLEDEGYERISFGEQADISVIHTCSVTGSADKKTRQAIRKAKQISPDGITVAMGCLRLMRHTWIPICSVWGGNEGFPMILWITLDTWC